MNALTPGEDGEPRGRVLRRAHGIQERAFVHPDGQVTLTRWALTSGRWSVTDVFTVPSEAAVVLAEVLAEMVTGMLEGRTLVCTCQELLREVHADGLRGLVRAGPCALHGHAAIMKKAHEPWTDAELVGARALEHSDDYGKTWERCKLGHPMGCRDGAGNRGDHRLHRPLRGES